MLGWISDLLNTPLALLSIWPIFNFVPNFHNFQVFLILPIFYLRLVSSNLVNFQLFSILLDFANFRFFPLTLLFFNLTNFKLFFSIMPILNFYPSCTCIFQFCQGIYISLGTENTNFISKYLSALSEALKQGLPL